jgi:hypothetical protein
MNKIVKTIFISIQNSVSQIDMANHTGQVQPNHWTGYDDHLLGSCAEWPEDETQNDIGHNMGILQVNVKWETDLAQQAIKRCQVILKFMSMC